MKKLVSRKNFLKEAGVLLVAAILVLTSIVIVPMTMAQPVPVIMEQPPHDVGIKSIDSPVDGCAGANMPMQVTVENYGDYTEFIDVQMEVLKCEAGPLLLDEHFNSWPGTWTDFGYELSYTDEAGGTLPEAYYGYYSGHYNSYGWIMTPPVVASNYCKIILEFNLAGYFDPNYDPNFYVNWTNDGGVTWHDVTPWTNPITSNLGPERYSIDICCGCGGCGDNFQVKWEFDGYYYYLEYNSGIYLDNVTIEGCVGYAEYAALAEYVEVPLGGVVVVPFPDWTPSDWGDPAYECSNVTYCVTAFTLLEDDGDPGNDCKSKDITLHFDSIPPVTTAIFNPALPTGLMGWYKGPGPVTVTLDATDNCGVVDYTKYSLDGGATWTLYTAPFPVSGCLHAGDFQFYSVDLCGNVESVVITNFKVDTILPVKHFVSFFLGMINLGIAKDDCSGLQKVEWYVGGSYLPPDTSISGVGVWDFFWRGFFPPPSGTVTTRVYDIAGNWV